MNDFDYLALSGRTLRLFLAVIEEGSVTRAAARLGLTQSAVSHALDRLRDVVGEPLFVRAGRAVTPTARALELAGQARSLLDGLKAFTRVSHFDPRGATIRLTVAVNDLERDLLLPPFLARLNEEGADATLRVVSGGAPTAEMLRGDRSDLVITPRPPSGVDILQKKLFSDHYVCFYDGEHRPPPRTLDDYLAARHVTVVYDSNDALGFDRTLEARGVHRRYAVTVPGFAAVPAFLRGTALLASLPSFLRAGLMRPFACVPLPMEGVELPMYMVWHVRNQNDPRHAWLRGCLETVARQASRSAEADVAAQAGQNVPRAGHG